jgi:hypothetical protein
MTRKTLRRPRVDQAAAPPAGVPELDYARDGELDLVTHVALPDAEHHGNVVCGAKTASTRAVPAGLGCGPAGGLLQEVAQLA